MVARDGIEPPTPAFSGPRSTTELPGLSADCVARSCAGIPVEPDEVGSLEQCAATTLKSIPTEPSAAKLRGRPAHRLLHLGEFCVPPFASALHWVSTMRPLTGIPAVLIVCLACISLAGQPVPARKSTASHLSPVSAQE